MYAGAIEARTVGASAYEPALDLDTNRAQDRNLFFGIPAIKGFPFNGSAVEVWDIFPGHTSPPPLTNTSAGGDDELATSRTRTRTRATRPRPSSRSLTS